MNSSLTNTRPSKATLFREILSNARVHTVGSAQIRQLSIDNNFQTKIPYFNLASFNLRGQKRGNLLKQSQNIRKLGMRKKDLHNQKNLQKFIVQMFNCYC